ncbi:MAG: Na+/H+ antiporter NhaA [Vicinamibacterales bacterium]
MPHSPADLGLFDPREEHRSDTLNRFASLPPGLRLGDLLVVGVAASIGFTVSLFFATAAFPAGSALAETKMGALLSFVAAPVALIVSRVIRPR